MWWWFVGCAGNGVSESEEEEEEEAEGRGLSVGISSSSSSALSSSSSSTSSEAEAASAITEGRLCLLPVGADLRRGAVGEEEALVDLEGRGGLKAGGARLG